MGVVRSWRSAGRRRHALVLLAAALLVLLGVRVPVELASTDHFPAQSPAHLAHALADFSNQPHVVSWLIEEDRSNYTTWRYSVSYACGARCGGRAAVLAHDEPLGAAPRHGRAARHHRVTLARRSCTTLPLLPWPQFCDDLEIAAIVSGSAEDGAQLQQVLRTRCSAVGWLSGACDSWLRTERDLRLLRLRALHQPPHAV